jgi:hypothetical protein
MVNPLIRCRRLIFMAISLTGIVLSFSRRDASAIDGACGNSNGSLFVSAPGSNLCTAGTPSTVTGAGPWFWKCKGSNGGGTAACRAGVLTSAIQLPVTGQTTCYDATNAAIACAGTGQDGDKLTGTAWPNPRFMDNNNGTVTDNLTGLVWLKNAACTGTVGGIAGGPMPWANAIIYSNSLATGKCGLTDGSSAGQWRLPNREELKSLVNMAYANPAAWLNSQGFTSVQTNGFSGYYWSSSTVAYDTGRAWYVGMANGGYVTDWAKTDYIYVLPVRAGQ